MPSQQDYANAIRVLSMDAVQQANSGHPGAPLGMADIAEVLWRDYLSHNPADPSWINRDRFVLSNGHGSALLYSLLHLSGYDLSIEDIRQFRQLHSKTPGHPEYGYTPGVETTTGPLGQGLCNAVGMAIAEKTLAAQFNQSQLQIIDHFTYVFLGDGCLMEGISHEACSLAGTLGLGKLIAFWDDNGISIDGKVEGWFTDDTAKRFESYGWQVISSVDGHNPVEIKAAIEMARVNLDRPTLICCQTVIGKGAPNQQGTSSVHGKPLGDEEILATRASLGWENENRFEIPEDIYEAWSAKAAGEKAQAAWQERFDRYQQAHPEQAAELMRRIGGGLPEQWSGAITEFIQHSQDNPKKVATRKASENVLNAIGPVLPELLGGSADLTGSNNTLWKGCEGLHETASGNYLYYGVREFGMTAMMNGMALYGGFIPYAGTFLVFMDYARNAVRMAALMKQRVVLVYTHDSIGLGEDGPTHQPIEHLSSLRAMPNLSVWRPCDQVETAVAWQAAIESKDGPSAIVLTRQGLEPLGRTAEQLAQVGKGAYIAFEPASEPKAVIIATGSEVELGIEAAKTLDVPTRVVSMPCAEAFLQQSKAYQQSVLPNELRVRVAVEAGSTGYWRQFVGLDGAVVGIDTFGESAPAKALFEHFEITVSAVQSAVKSLL